MTPAQNRAQTATFVVVGVLKRYLPAVAQDAGHADELFQLGWRYKPKDDAGSVRFSEHMKDLCCLTDSAFTLMG